MAVSIKNEGVINPIEIDKDFVIITGEMRWRSSKQAGLKTVPCKILDLEGDERFLRQMHENIHELTMNDWDTAQGLKKTAEILALSQGETGKDKFHKSDFFSKSVSMLAKEYGKSHGWISEHLSLLEQVGKIRKGLESGVVNHTRIRALSNVPEEHQDFVEGLVLQVETPRESVIQVSNAIKRSDDTAIEKIKKTDWKGKKPAEVASILDKIAPRKIESVEEASKEVQKKIIELIEVLEKYPIAFFGSLSSVAIIPYIVRLGNFLGDYVLPKKLIKKS